MFNTAFRNIKTVLLLSIVLTVITGLIYPLLVTSIAQMFFPWRANGSLIKQNETIIGSVLIGQLFDKPNYFWGRPSATSPFPYNAESSSGSNMGPSNPALIKMIQIRGAKLQAQHKNKSGKIPVEMLTASGSGLDPDISPIAAYYQVSRVANVNHLPENEVNALIQRLTMPRTLGILGEPRINVLMLNIALDKLREIHGRTSTQSGYVIETNPG